MTLCQELHHRVWWAKSLRCKKLNITLFITFNHVCGQSAYTFWYVSRANPFFYRWSIFVFFRKKSWHKKYFLNKVFFDCIANCKHFVVLTARSWIWITLSKNEVSSDEWQLELLLLPPVKLSSRPSKPTNWRHLQEVSMASLVGCVSYTFHLFHVGTNRYCHTAQNVPPSSELKANR